MTVGAISEKMFTQLKAITPSIDRKLLYYPCQVTTTDGRVHPCVYIVDANQFITLWSPTANITREVKIEDVAYFEESPCRLPAPMANKLYLAGESGMGYCVFKVLFKDGTSQCYQTGDAVDFIRYPLGKSSADIVDVIPHEGRGEPTKLKGNEYAWCLYSGVSVQRSVPDTRTGDIFKWREEQ
jgi:hypothetical protein